MIFEQHYLECLSQASYFIADEATGRAVVVDPRRDVSIYLEAAAEHGATIELIIETHFHADFLSGHLELAAATGAEIAYGSAAETEFPSRKLADGETITLGSVELEIRHTPGHTPESISIVVSEEGSAEPYAVLTGDTLFVGDVGRPDLLSSVGVTADHLAEQLYDSLHDKLMTLPDAVRVYPGHGAGSACGKNLSSDTWSTIGDQRSTNYALAAADKAAFVEVVTAGQTAPPAYFAYDAMQNRLVHPMLDESALPAAMTYQQVVEHQADRGVVLDTRDPDVFVAAHVVDSINVGLGGRFSEFTGGVIAPETPIVIVAEPERVLESKNRLARVGFDNVVGHLADAPGTLATLDPSEVGRGHRVDVDGLLAAIDSTGQTDDRLQLVDVRQPGETEGGVIADAVLVPLTQLNDRMHELDPNRPTIVYCAGGYRSSIAASRLVNAGFTDVGDLIGGYGAWDAAGRATVLPR